jgi:hypothetical protein
MGIGIGGGGGREVRSRWLYKTSTLAENSKSKALGKKKKEDWMGLSGPNTNTGWDVEG